MKANGRRRWRRWAANGRRRWRKWARTYRKYAKRTSDADFVAMAAWWRRHTDLEVIQPLPPRPFSPRSLVGMTQRARKRAAWKSFSERARYHIGQRLRPCPGCLRCRSCVGCEVLTFEGDTCEDCGRETPMATESCDGSGVLPARRAKS